MTRRILGGMGFWCFALFAPALADAATLRGTVVDAATRQPPTDPSIAVSVWNEGEALVGTRQLDAQGRYRFEGLPAGIYRMRIAASHYLDYCWKDERDFFCQVLGTPIVLAAGTDFVADVALAPFGRVAGTVKHQDGSPFSGVPVRYQGLHQNLGVLGAAITDELGRYRTDPLPAGDYWLSIDDFAGHYGITYPHALCTPFSACPEAEVVSVVDGAPTDGIDFELRRGGSIRGRVIDSEGEPLGLEFLQVFDRHGRVVDELSVPSDAAYTTGLLPPDRYTVRAGSFDKAIHPDLPCDDFECDVRFGQPVVVAAGQTLSGIDVVIPRKVQVRAVLRDAGTQQPLSYGDVEVVLVDARSGFRIGGQYDGEFFVFDHFGVAPGRYYVVAWGPRWRTEVLGGRHIADHTLDEIAKSDVLEVPPRQATHFEMALDPAARVRGLVRLPSGEPAAGCTIRVFRHGTELDNDPLPPHCDEDGRFELDLQPGPTRLLFYGNLFDELGAGLLASRIPCSFDLEVEPPRLCDLTQTPVLELAEGQELDLGTLDLPAPGRIEGQVRPAEIDGPFGTGRVEVHDLAGRVIRSTTAQVSSTESTSAYFIDGLAPGSYKVVFLGRPEVAGEVYPGLDCQVPLCDSQRGQVVVLPPGGTRAGIDFSPDRALPDSCTIFTDCLSNDRFHVKVRWTTADGQSGAAYRQSPDSDGPNPDTGYYWFFSPDNTELLVKVLDACDPFQRFWVFAAGTTNVGVDIEVRDSITGATRRYHHTAGAAFEPVLDTDAFGCGAAAATPLEAGTGLEADVAAVAPQITAPEAAVAPPANTSLCRADNVSRNTLCLLNHRFRIDATWHSFDGSEGRAVVSRHDLGSLWFFDPANVELLLKVLDGCAINGHYWVFGSGLTNVGVRVLVTDSHTDRQKVYENPLGQAFVPILDTEAFRCWRE